jgi:hypothetical protein
VSVLEKGADLFKSRPIGVGIVEARQMNGLKCPYIRDTSLSICLSQQQVTLYLSEILYVFSGELRSKGNGIFGLVKARARADDVQSLRRDSKPSP